MGPSETNSPGTFYKLFGIISCLILIIISAFGQDLKFDHITITDGLPSNLVMTICQDRQGFLWFGSGRGLIRYDGYNFRVFQADGTPGSLSSNMIINLYEDHQGILWVGTDLGLNKFHRDTGLFTGFQSSDADLSSLSDNRILQIFEDDHHRLWIGTRRGLNLYNPKDQTFTRISDDFSAGEYGDRILAIGESDHYDIVVGTPRGIYRVDIKNKHLVKIFPNNDSTISDNDYFTAFLFDGQIVWLNKMKKGLIKYNLKSQKLKEYTDLFTGPSDLRNNLVFDIYQDSSEMLWLSTIQGLYVVNPSRSVGTVYYHDSGDALSLSQNDIRKVVEDRSGNYWIGTLGGGINKLTKNSLYFHHIRQGNDSGRHINNQMVWSIFQDSQDDLWIGTDSGLNYWDKKRKRFHYYLDGPPKRLLFFNNMIMTIGEDVNQDIWIGTSGGGLKHFNKKNKTFQSFYYQPKNPNSMSSNTISVIFKDSLGKLWIGTDYGLNSYNYRTGDFTRYFSDPEKVGSLRGRVIMDLYEDSSQRLWIGTGLGLNRYDRVKDQFVHQLLPGFEQISITKIYEDRNRDLWLGTEQGLLRYRLCENELTKYGKESGFPQLAIMGILEDDQGILWISTSNGLFKFDKTAGSVSDYHKNDGVQGEQFNPRVCLKSQEGNLYFGGMNGITYFNPEEINTNRLVPPMVVTEFKLFNQPVRPDLYSVVKQEITESDQINLKYNQNFFSFEFSALDFTNQKKNRYRYRLNGIDKNWIYTSADHRIANYTGIKHGTFTFVVQGSNNDGIWNEEGAEIKLIIHPPFWKTWWFRMICILLSMIVINSFYRKRIRKIETKIMRKNAHNVACVKYNISSREKEILTLILQGKSNKEIEDLLYISYNTVKNHVYNILNKIGVKDRGKLIIFFKDIQDSAHN